MKFLKRLFLLLILVAVVGTGFYLFRDMTPPTVEVSPGTGPIGPDRPLVVTLADPGLGLAGMQVSAVQGERTVELLNRDYPAETASAEERLTLRDADFEDGPIQIRVRATDRARVRFGKGNSAEVVQSFVLDSRPPQMSILTRQHNFNQGGAGAIVYSISEEVEKSGVRVGDLFFPGHRQPAGTWVCLFAFPWDMPMEDFVPRLVAVDSAGNEQALGFYYHANPRTFPQDRITISDRFLTNKIVPTFQHLFPDTTDPLQLFLKVNGELRRANTATIRELGQRTGDRPLWEGAFLRQPRAATPGFFAQRRTYYHEGEVIDHQTHLGLDLASTAHAPVVAANSGRVVHAAELGIYGQCVIIDHGLGLQSLYGHLSQIEVEEGDTVEQGATIGHTGTTGLAGGDHLHFDVLVGGIQVNPIEWLDPNWVRINIREKLQLAEN